MDERGPTGRPFDSFMAQRWFKGRGMVADWCAEANQIEVCSLTSHGGRETQAQPKIQHKQESTS